MPFCKNCGANVKQEAKACPKCGTQRTGIKETNAEEKITKTDAQRRVLWPLLAIGIIIITIILIPTKTVSYTVTVPYDAQEAYNDSEPFIEEQCESREYDSLAKYGYSIRSLDWPQHICLPNGDRCGLDKDSVMEYRVSNYEKKSGNFVIKIRYVTKDFQVLEGYDFVYSSLNVGPGSTEEDIIYLATIVDNQPKELTEGYFLAILKKPSLKECTEATSFRYVTKYRTVTKYREETRDKKVNWIFGFDPPF